ncbi:hypothetical protein [Actinokineospora sp.]|uniref:hypothetical protein n=1 Tax=Actinokineospora sp. TaxID=1872133 RepID=UPI003D6A8BD9
MNTSTQDWYTTYYGGQGVHTAGPGIQAAADARSLIATIQGAPTPSAVPVYLLAGGAANIHHDGEFGQPPPARLGVGDDVPGRDLAVLRGPTCCSTVSPRAGCSPTG